MWILVRRIRKLSNWFLYCNVGDVNRNVNLDFRQIHQRWKLSAQYGEINIDIDLLCVRILVKQRLSDGCRHYNTEDEAFWTPLSWMSWLVLWNLHPSKLQNVQYTMYTQYADWAKFGNNFFLSETLLTLSLPTLPIGNVIADCQRCQSAT